MEHRFVSHTPAAGLNSPQSAVIAGFVTRSGPTWTDVPPLTPTMDPAGLSTDHPRRDGTTAVGCSRDVATHRLEDQREFPA